MDPNGATRRDFAEAPSPMTADFPRTPSRAALIPQPTRNVSFCMLPRASSRASTALDVSASSSSPHVVPAYASKAAKSRGAEVASATVQGHPSSPYGATTAPSPYDDWASPSNFGGRTPTSLQLLAAGNGVLPRADHHQTVANGQEFFYNEKPVTDGGGGGGGLTEYQRGLSRRTCLLVLALHASLLLLFTACVFVAVHWNNVLAVESREGNALLVDRRDGHPIGLQPLVVTDTADKLSNPSISASAKILSAIVALPREGFSAKNATTSTAAAHDGPLLQRLYGIEAVEVRWRSNTTILWMTGGHVLVASPGRVSLLDTKPRKSLYTWASAANNSSTAAASTDDLLNFASDNELDPSSVTSQAPIPLVSYSPYSHETLHVLAGGASPPFS